MQGESGSSWSAGSVAETLRQEVSTELMVDTSTSPNNSYNGDTGKVVMIVCYQMIPTEELVFLIFKW